MKTTNFRSVLTINLVVVVAALASSVAFAQAPPPPPPPPPAAANCGCAAIRAALALPPRYGNQLFYGAPVWGPFAIAPVTCPPLTALPCTQNVTYRTGTQLCDPIVGYVIGRICPVSDYITYVPCWVAPPGVGVVPTVAPLPPC